MAHSPHDEIEIDGVTYRLIYRLRPTRECVRWLAVADGADVTAVLKWQNGEWQVDREYGR